MSSLTLRDIGLKPTQMRAVARRAKKAGKTPSEYVRSLVERDLLAGESFDEVLKPIRQGFQESGVTEEELDALVARARKAHRAQRKLRK
ncbi:MAG TPA: hypothetical protein VN541_09050 [Tepidisphaeraceae bacterium]|nr:hypothetical protein [Tepidisphaeraceae bacterium]